VEATGTPRQQANKATQWRNTTFWTARRGIISRRMVIGAAAMVPIAFALGYLLHPR
jgi:hypothetical protein